MRSEKQLLKIEKLLITLACVLGTTVIIGLILLVLYFGKDQTEQKNMQQEENNLESGEENKDTALDDITSILPDHCNLNQELPEFTLYREDGSPVSMEQFRGKITILTFWASWCPDCQQELPMVNDFIEIAKKYGDINYILVNKLDQKKETKESANAYLSEQQIAIDTYFDQDLTAYETLGLHNIPTTLFLDENGILRAWCPRQITKGSVFEAYLRNASEGSGNVTAQFVVKEMMDEQGGIHTVYSTTKDKTNSSEVLSETQGAMLEYAVLSENKELFDRILNYINTYMRSSGLTAWRVIDQKADGSNALIDDFRIYTALQSANAKWGGYNEVLIEYQQAIASRGISHNRYVDFYSSETKKYAKRFTLCYGDLKAMAALADAVPELDKPYKDAKNILSGGYISDEFPLYYSWYNDKTNAYEKDDLNAAEAMMTLLHLAEVGQLKETTIAWLKTQMSLEGVKARYTVRGEIVDGYRYDSTAVYAIIAMIAEEIGDDELQGQALRKMEKMRINDMDYIYNGAFGLEDGSAILSFDQVMATLAYEYTK